MSKRIVAPKNWVRQSHVDAARQAAKIAVTFYRCGKREVASQIWAVSMVELV